MKLLVVDDHSIMLHGYREIFAKNVDIMLYEASAIAEARPLVKQLRPDVIVINANLPDGCGFDFTRRLTKKSSKLKVVLFSTTDEPYVVMRAIDCGAKGFITKTANASEVRAAIDAVGNGKTWINDDLLQKVAFTRVTQQPYQPRLTRREKNVLNLLLHGRNPSEIATELNISSTLVSTDCAAMCRKLNARTKAEMVAIAIRSDLGKSS